MTTDKYLHKLRDLLTTTRLVEQTMHAQANVLEHAIAEEEHFMGARELDRAMDCRRIPFSGAAEDSPDAIARFNAYQDNEPNGEDRKFLEQIGARW